jgi:prevent-host-death family protein
MRTTSRGRAPSRRTIGIRDAKARLSELLADVQRGHEWTITERGKPVARIVPMSATLAPVEERLRALEQSGLIERVLDVPRSIPPPLRLEPGLARRMLDESRDS